MRADFLSHMPARLGTWVLGGAMAAFGVPFLAGDSGYYQYMIEIIAIYVLASAGLNIAIGFAGQYQMAQGAVMGTAAYAMAVLHLDLEWPILASIVASLALALLVGALVGLLSSRLNSHYFLLATFGVLIIIVGFFRHLEPLTGGSNGRLAVVELPFGDGTLTGSTAAYSTLLIAVAVVGLFISSWLKSSYLGLAIAATRQSERVAQASGLYANRFKFLAVLISTAFAAVAGILIGPVHTYLEPTSFGIEITLLLLIMVVVGGAGSVFGVAVSAILLAIASQIAQGATTAWPLIYGLFVMIVLALTNRGLAGLWRDLQRKFLARASAPVGQASAPVSAEAQSRPEPETTEADASSPILRIEDVRRAFGGVVAVDKVTFDVSRGMIHGVVGPNGSGKTTLFEILSGFVASDRGSILFGGQPITRLAPAKRARMGIGRSFQLASILPESTVLENVLVGTIASLSVGERLAHAGAALSGRHVDRALAALEVVGLAHLRDKEASTLAYGQRKLLDIARVIVSRPTLALLDEPLAGVDAISAGYVRRAITFLRQSGCTVMLVEHNMRFVVELSDRVTVLDAGKVLVTGTPQEATSNPDVVRSYLGERRGGRRDWRRKSTRDDGSNVISKLATSGATGI